MLTTSGFDRFSQDLRYADMSLPGSIINIAFRGFYLGYDP